MKGQRMTDTKKGRVSRLRLAGHDSESPPLIVSEETARALKARVSAAGGNPRDIKLLRKAHAELIRTGSQPRVDASECPPCTESQQGEITPDRVLSPLELQYREAMLARVGPPTRNAYVSDAAICRWWPSPSADFDALVADHDSGTLPRWIHPADFIALAFPPDCAMAVPRARFKAAVYTALRADELGCQFTAEYHCEAVTPAAWLGGGLGAVKRSEIVELETEEKTEPAMYGIEIRQAQAWLASRPDLVRLLPSDSPLRINARGVTPKGKEKRGHDLGSLQKAAALLSDDANYYQEQSRDVLVRTIYSGLEQRGKASLPLDSELFGAVTSKLVAGISSMDRRTFKGVCAEVIANPPSGKKAK